MEQGLRFAVVLKLAGNRQVLIIHKCVFQRIMAAPDHPQRSRLSIMAQHLCDVKLCFNMPGAVFVPRPKVRHSPQA